ncbi:hypothetical protein ABIC86_002354 [Paenibacillus sp. DS2363]|uniref:hypothetical protein n=1 Tax=unclassified Paenibacillus TaxID=185978 RepID=UPI0030F52611
MIVLTSAIAFTFLILIVILFQVALAVGVPWGEYAMGGKFPGKYPISNNHCHFITMSNKEIYKNRALACMPKGSINHCRSSFILMIV